MVGLQRSPYAINDAASAGTQKVKKKGFREPLDVCDTEANEEWLATMLQSKDECAQSHKTSARRLSQTETKHAQQPMSVNDLKQKSMLLPYLNKIEYMNCQLRQRGLMPAAKRLSHLNQDDLCHEGQGLDATEVLRRRYPRLFQAVMQRHSGKLFQPRRREINWLFRTIEGIYSALTYTLMREIESESELVYPEARTSREWLAMPLFTRRLMHHAFGLPQLADQECVDLMYTIELTCAHYPQVAQFASFLREIDTSDTLLFFLFVRKELQAAFDLNFASKEKRAHGSSPSRVNTLIATKLLAFRPHAFVPNGHKQVFLPAAACEIVLQRVLDASTRLCLHPPSQTVPSSLLTHYIVHNRFQWPFLTDESPSMISLDTFLTTLVQLFRDVADDVIAHDESEAMSHLSRLQTTLSVDATIESDVALYTAQARDLRNQRMKVMKLARRKPHDEFRTEWSLLKHQLSLQEQELQHLHMKISESERSVEHIWKQVIAAKPLQQARRRPWAQETTSSMLGSVLGRFEAYVESLYTNHGTGATPLPTLAFPWRKQMEELKVRMVLRVQHAFRSRRRDWERKRKARAERELKLRNERFEVTKLPMLSEKDVKIQEEIFQRELQDRRKKGVRKAQHQEIVQHAVAKMKKERIVFVMFQWKQCVLNHKQRRQADIHCLKWTFKKWKGHWRQSQCLTRAARTIQRSMRKRKERVKLRKVIHLRVKHNRIAKKYLRKLQTRAISKLFTHWIAFTDEQQRFDHVVTLIMQQRARRWFKSWIEFTTRIKTQKLQSILLIQRQYRGRLARRFDTILRTRHGQSIVIQRVYRGMRGRVMARKQRDGWMVQNKQGEMLLRRVRTREIGEWFNKWVQSTRRILWIKERTQRRQRAIKQRVVQSWHGRVALRKEQWRQVHSSASVIQRQYRRYLCHLRLRELASLYRAAVQIQCVYRGYRGRCVAQCRRWEGMAAIGMQTMWRRYRAKMYVAAVRTEKVFVATQKGDYTTVKRALGTGVGYIFDTQGNSLLHRAAAAGHKRLVKLCLRHSIDINLVNDHDQTALHLVLAYLFPIQNDKPALATKARDDRVALGAYLIDHGAWTEARDKEGLTPLLLCAAFGQSDAIEMLLSRGADTEARTWKGNLNAPQLAVDGNHAGTLKALLDSGSFDSGDSGRTTIFLVHTCAERGFTDCARVLVTHIRQRSPVFGYDVLDWRDVEGYTPLIYAVNHGFFEGTQTLLEADANPDTTDRVGRTPLHFALNCSKVETREPLVHLLIQYEANVNATDCDGDAPLHVSCLEDTRFACTRLLLTSGAFLTANRLGNYPTHIAAHNGAVKTLQLLLEYGGDVNVRNFAGKTVVGLARMNDQQAVVQFVAASFTLDKFDGLKEESEIDPERSTVQMGTTNVIEHSFRSAQEDGTHGRKIRKVSEWTTAVANAYCMGSLAEWTQYIDPETEMPFYYSINPLGDPVYTWDPSIEFQACMGSNWEIVRGVPNRIASESEAVAKPYYLYHNQSTGDLTTRIPRIDYVFLQTIVQNATRVKRFRRRIQKESADAFGASTMEYLHYFRGFKEESAQFRHNFHAAMKIQRHFRARRTKVLVKAVVHQNQCIVNLQRAFRRQQGRREATLRWKQSIQVVSIQAAYRGYHTRQREAQGDRKQRQHHLRRRLAAQSIQRIFRGFLGRKQGHRERVMQRLGPKTSSEWEDYCKRATVIRKYKDWEELESSADFFPILFYYHRRTQACSWYKPVPWVQYDHEALEARQQLVHWGYTTSMLQATYTLQRWWRARVTRRSFRRLLHAVGLMKTCEQAYLTDPTHIVKLSNYVLYLHTITHDYERARRLYPVLMQRMTDRGPDVPFVLFSYALFVYVTLENDVAVVKKMIARGKRADPTLQKYKVAFYGFFRQAILQKPENAEAHINYAACTHLLYERYEEATEHYFKALALAPHRKGGVDLFQTMLTDQKQKDGRRTKLQEMQEVEEEERFDAFAQFRRWQAKQAEAEDRARRRGVDAEQGHVATAWTVASTSLPS